MTRIVGWFARLLGMQSQVEECIESNVRLNTAIAGAMAQAEAWKEAEQYANELEKTHPHLATALRGKIAEAVGLPAPTPCAVPGLEPPPTPALPEAKKPTGRPRKVLASAPVHTPTPTGGQ
jgi:hypothetical protein